MRVDRLKNRADFLRVADGRRKRATPGFILQARRSDAAEDGCRIGFTASRKVGSAVARNRAKRRLRAAAAAVLARAGRAGTDYVLIARSETAKRPYALLMADLEAALAALGAARDGRA